MWLEKVLGHRPSRRGVCRPGGIAPHPLPALRARFSWEAKRLQRMGSAFVVAQARLSIPFNSPSAPYLRAASRGPHPSPARPSPGGSRAAGF